MSRPLILLLLILLGACTSASDPQPAESPRLTEGTWTGTLTPMNHPDMHTPLTYEVAYAADTLGLVLGGPNGSEMPAREAEVKGNTLFFSFDEPDAGVPLRCALARTEDAGFEGRCVDPEGKWALFSMQPPADA